MADTENKSEIVEEQNPDSRRDEILRRMLKTPPKPHKPVTGEAEAAPVSKDRE